MKNKLCDLFDYQRFRKNERLEAIIAQTEKKYKNNHSVNRLSYDDLEHISAAGDAEAYSKKPFDKEDFDA